MPHSSTTVSVMRIPELLPGLALESTARETLERTPEEHIIRAAQTGARPWGNLELQASMIQIELLYAIAKLGVERVTPQAS